MKIITLLTIGLAILSIATLFAFASGKSKITLFFLDDSVSLTLKQEERNVDMPSGVIGEMKVVLRNLIAGSKKHLISPIPQDTKLKEVFFDNPNKIVYVDFSDNLRKNHIGGTTAELSTIKSIFKTLQANFPKSINMVQILIDGREIDTLTGHISLSRPLPINIFESKVTKS